MRLALLLLLSSCATTGTAGMQREAGARLSSCLHISRSWAEQRRCYLENWIWCHDQGLTEDAGEDDLRGRDPSFVSPWKHS